MIKIYYKSNINVNDLTSEAFDLYDTLKYKYDKQYAAVVDIVVKDL
ncbi:hypothetical protein OSC52_12080 [Clostridium pasteurianum]|nr:hypothetical protein [Clostridium pasteurianum]UZW12594.1 hypothetical protein OSC52_12080 [Clostridium pasteurianum]